MIVSQRTLSFYLNFILDTNSDDRCGLYHFFVSDRFLLKSIFLTVLKASVDFCSCI